MPDEVSPAPRRGLVRPLQTFLFTLIKLRLAAAPIFRRLLIKVIKLQLLRRLAKFQRQDGNGLYKMNLHKFNEVLLIIKSQGIPTIASK